MYFVLPFTLHPKCLDAGLDIKTATYDEYGILIKSMNGNENGGEWMRIGAVCIMQWNCNLNILAEERREKVRLDGDKEEREEQVRYQ